MGRNQRSRKRDSKDATKVTKGAKVTNSPKILSFRKTTNHRQPLYKSPQPPTDEQSHALRKLYDHHCRIRSLAYSNRYIKSYNTVMDNGAHISLLGYEDWIVLNKHKAWIKSEGALGSQRSETLQIVDARTTLVNKAGVPIAIGQLNQGVYCPSNSSDWPVCAPVRGQGRYTKEYSLHHTIIGPYEHPPNAVEPVVSKFGDPEFFEISSQAEEPGSKDCHHV